MRKITAVLDIRASRDVISSVTVEPDGKVPGKWTESAGLPSSELFCAMTILILHKSLKESFVYSRNTQVRIQCRYI